MIHLIQKTNRLNKILLLFLGLNMFSCAKQTVFIATYNSIEQGLNSNDPEVQAQARELQTRVDSGAVDTVIVCPDGFKYIPCASNQDQDVLWYTKKNDDNCGCVDQRVNTTTGKQIKGGGDLTLHHDPDCVECPGAGCCLAMYRNTNYQLFLTDSLIFRQSDNEQNSRTYKVGDSPENGAIIENDNGFIFFRPNTRLIPNFDAIDQLIIGGEVIPVDSRDQRHRR